MTWIAILSKQDVLLTHVLQTYLQDIPPTIPQRIGLPLQQVLWKCNQAILRKRFKKLNLDHQTTEHRVTCMFSQNKMKKTHLFYYVYTHIVTFMICFLILSQHKYVTMTYIQFNNVVPVNWGNTLNYISFSTTRPTLLNELPILT